MWAPLLKRTGPDKEHPERVAIQGTFHMLRHFFVTALIQSGVNAKVAQTLAGHHSAAFTLDQYADAVPQQLEEAGEKVSTVLLEASGSILVAETKQTGVRTAQVIELESAPGEIRTPDPQVRSLMLYPTELRARGCDLTENPAGPVIVSSSLLVVPRRNAGRNRLRSAASARAARRQSQSRRGLLQPEVTDAQECEPHRGDV